MPSDVSKRSATARRGAQGLHDSFYDATDPALPAEERERLADEARREFYRGRARMGAHARNANASSAEAITRAARDAAFQRFYEATDASLPDEERQRQAKSLQRLFMQGLALKRATRRKQAQVAMNRLIEAEAEAAVLGADAV